ncbi:tetratricopeptide repeat protein 12-like [Fopius arisanus]|uniref:Tetratricopeptide repeat protein 12-like n=1 Tax=Fopius arisanus TaxID=64838 RepID=A0A9R1TEH8_9HYME|nr:PREDICTED: tetratricopeptide repeat protein 12-like [Fopius arisanus]XP_011308825.1 PREDICTED: tetratricopeptide repeat protein 12-like [Fopius arisanus]
MEFPFEKQETSKNLCSQRHITEEEFQNFMQRVTEVEKIVKKLASSDVNEQNNGKLLADNILKSNNAIEGNLSGDEELKTRTDRTLINNCSTSATTDSNTMSKEVFMKTMEKDARERAEDKKRRNERADTYKRIGNGAFDSGDYEKAVTYYGKAIEQRKDSTVIWNNRALSFMRLGLYEKALQDCEWALKVNDSNIKALLNSAKCYAYLGNHEKRDEFIRLSKERIPRFSKYIEDFEKALKENPNDVIQDEESIV